MESGATNTAGPLRFHGTARTRHHRLSPRKGSGTDAGFLGPCFATLPGYPHFKFLAMLQDGMAVLHTSNGGWDETGEETGHPHK